MVNSKNVAFKVDRQVPTSGPPPLPFSTVINCRKPGGRRAAKKSHEVESHQVPLASISSTPPQALKRKRGLDNVTAADELSKKLLLLRDGSHAAPNGTTSGLSESGDSLPAIRSKVVPKPRARRGKTFTKDVDLDCWFTIFTFSDPAQLLEMRHKISLCFRFLRDNPTLWKHSRTYYYGSDIPDPPSELTEFQYAHLRHGHGCMSCGAVNTRKTYWAFLRRWCKPCFLSKTLKEPEVVELLKDDDGENISFLRKCLPAGVVDSWGNFVGAGPAHTQSLKAVYLRSDVEELVAEFIRESRDNYVSWHAEMRTWMNNKAAVMEERRAFARKMELWEDVTRTSKSHDYQGKKDARKAYYIEMAAKLSPPISALELSYCGSYRRAIAIPKDPNMISWQQLRPKLETEVGELRASGTRLEDLPPIHSTSGTATPDTSIPNAPVIPMLPLPNPTTAPIMF
ncbi:hypothetical protein P154DRAFT_519048 [Amniculicola lignicola CBS 123094]|uniref:F-box domain-containing protein n=1 Tax=Amniculicola lignicola CBS 123094 TaxID=1392246 RepID=A0A6A5WTI7_9PLEO|nr:hypothetical protein P154DRAFT_519048 [Amniculicola lignicola CBS 123094]